MGGVLGHAVGAASAPVQNEFIGHAVQMYVDCDERKKPGLHVQAEALELPDCAVALPHETYIAFKPPSENESVGLIVQYAGVVIRSIIVPHVSTLLKGV